jgi:hypothetical protein
MSELLHIGAGGWTRIAEVRPQNPMAWVRRLAGLQGGVIDRAQLLACGISASKIKRLERAGWLIVLLPGVYALGHLAITPRGRLVAALLYGGYGSALSHSSSAYQWRLIDKAPSAVHVSTTRRRRPVQGVELHQRTSIVAAVRDGLPVTGPAQALMEIATQCTDYEMRKALANADYHGLLNSSELRQVMGRGHPGSANLRRALSRHMPELATTLSPFEDMFLLLCERHGVPLPTPNGEVGPYRPDALWEEAKLVVELDGGANHSSPTQRRIDAERDMYLRANGYLVLRYTYWQIERQAPAVAAEILEALAARATPIFARTNAI